MNEGTTGSRLNLSVHHEGLGAHDQTVFWLCCWEATGHQVSRIFLDRLTELLPLGKILFLPVPGGSVFFFQAFDTKFILKESQRK